MEKVSAFESDHLTEPASLLFPTEHGSAAARPLAKVYNGELVAALEPLGKVHNWSYQDALAFVAVPSREFSPIRRKHRRAA
jgi:hypothetical protein